MTPAAPVPEIEVVLDEIERRLAMQGYTLIRRPGASELPDFLGSFRPDAIAVGKTPNLVVEIVGSRGSSGERAASLERLRELVSDQAGWRLEVAYYTPIAPNPGVASPGALRRRLQEVRRLGEHDRPAALILAWALLEAVARAIAPDRAVSGLTPGAAIELLASQGQISQPEADALREVGRARNLIVHGDLGVTVHKTQLEGLMKIVDALLQRAVEQPVPA